MTLIVMPGYKEPTPNNNPFIGGLKPVVFVGRVLGAISRSDVLKRKESHRLGFAKIYSGFLTVFFFINAILQWRANIKRFQTDATTSAKLGELGLPGYATTMFFVYAYQFLHTKRFRNVVQSFQVATQRLQLTTPFPRRYRWFCWTALVICLLFGIVENVLYDLKNIKGGGQGVSVLERYYTQNFYHWAELIPYNPLLISVFVIIIKFGTWGWVYNDVIAIVLSRAIAEKFWVMNEEIGLMMRPTAMMTLKSKIHDGRILTLTWDSFRDEFVMLSDLVVEIQTFISPLILACYGVNMYIIIINLFYWIAPDSTFSVEQSSYVYFAFVQFLFRVSTVTYFVAEVNHVSSSVIQTIQRCPNSLYTLSLERLERTLISTPTGICLFGSFLITRSFFISIISFLFTTEIVLLQTTNAVSSPAPPAPK